MRCKEFVLCLFVVVCLKSFSDMGMGNALASTWRLHLSFNESSHQTRPVSASSEMTFNECFSAALSSDNVGILLVELRNLNDETLAMGGVEISPEAIAEYSVEGGATLRMTGDTLDGVLGLGN
jgi:hypothetical protein